MVRVLSCFHPLRALIYEKDCYGKPLEKKVVRFLKPCDRDAEKYWNSEEVVFLPCGQCIGCRLQRSRQWANRLMLELEYHQSAYFVTLTYNDKHVPVSYYSDPDTGEAFPAMTLRMKDIQLFMKRLRKRFGKVRYYACGEYGPETMRPHYHLIIFGLKLDDLVFKGKNEMGDLFYTSQKLEETWSERIAPVQYGYTNCLTADKEDFYDCLGFVSVSEVTWNTCAYVARYVTTKLTGKMSSFYDVFNIEPPFSLMSRKPGIARQWYEDHPDCYDYEYISISTPKGGRKFRPPRYFDKLYDEEHKEEMKKIKEMRKRMAMEAVKAKLFQSSLSVDEILAAEERNTESRVKSLIRDL